MKICKSCKEEKSIEEFYSHQKMTDGRLNICKECVKSRVRNHYKENGDQSALKEKGVVRVIYKSQKRHQRLRGHGLMPYTKSELEDWLYKNGFKRLYDLWISNGMKSADKPSVDRIDSNLGYSLENIQLGTWQQNRDAQAKDIVSGEGSSGKRCKATLKLDENNKVICRYVSYSSAARDMGYNLERQIKLGIKCRNGFFWRYE